MRVPPKFLKPNSLYKLIGLYSLAILLFLPINNLIAQCSESVNAGSDIFLCENPGGETVFLSGSVSGNPLFTEWSPTDAVADFTSLATSANVSESTTFTLTSSYISSTNLVVNGDFESGNEDFTSDYSYTTSSLWNEGVYAVIPNPNALHTNFSGCGDHTSGTGNMMVVNGASGIDVPIWCQTVTVVPGTSYAFSVWIASVVSSSPANLEFTINGVSLGAPIRAATRTCEWDVFFTIWEADASTADICITNQNTAGSGNDFALDDISVAEICEQSDFINVYVDDMELTLSEPEDLNCENSSVEIIATYATPFGSDFLTNWNTSDGNIIGDGFSDNVIVDAPGTYTFTFFNYATGCVLEESVEVGGNNSAPMVDAGEGFEIDCINTTVVLDGTASDDDSELTFVWTTEDGNIVSNEETLTPTVDAPGTYILTITNEENGCSESGEVSVVSIAALPEIEAIAEDNFDCITESVFLNGSGSEEGDDISYEWLTTDGNIVSGDDGLNPEVDLPGTYSLIVTNTANGCTSIIDVLVEENIETPDYDILSSGLIDCETGSVVLEAIFEENANLDFTYKWTTDSGSFTGNTDEISTTVDQGGSYTLVVINNLNGCSTMTDISVGENLLPPNVQIEAAPSIDCLASEIVLDASNSDQGDDLIYEWTTEDGNIISDIDGLNLTIDGAGTYQFVITNTANGCTNIAEVTIEESIDLPSVMIAIPDELTCQITSTNLSAINEDTDGNYTYEWVTLDGNIVSGSNGLNPEVEGAGTYQLLVTNPVNGCTVTEEITVVENTASPEIDIDLPADLNCMVEETILTVNVDGDTNNYDFSWASTDGIINSGANENNPVAGAAGTYEVTVTDTNSGCTSTAWVVVNEIVTEPFVEAGQAQMLTCNEASLNLSGEAGLTANLVFEWTTTNGSIEDGANSLNPTINAPGIYTLTVTDITNGCSSTDEVEVTQDLNAPISDAGPASTLNCFIENYTLDGTNSSTGPEFIFEWTTQDGSFESDENTLTPTVNASGTYQLTILNTNNQCETISTVTIDENTVLPPVEIENFEHINCLNNTTFLASLLQTNPDLSVSWSTIDGDITYGFSSSGIIANTAGTYTLTVLDEVNNCISTLDVDVLENFETPEVDAGQGDTINCSQTNLALNGTDINMLGNNNYVWTTDDGNIISGENTLSPMVNQAGTYTLTAIHELSGCEANALVIIGQNEDLPQVNIEAPQMLNCSLASLNLDASQSSSGSEFTYSWTTTDGSIISGANSLTPEIDAIGTYNLNILNGTNQCENFAEIIVEQNITTPEFDFPGPYQVNCEINTTSILNLNNQNNLEYIWETNDGSYTEDLSNTGIVATAGTYNVTITDSVNGCSTNTTIEVLADAEIPEVDAGVAPAIDCNLSQITLDGMVANDNGQYSYEWTTNNGNIISGANGLTPTVDQAGTYTLTVLNLNSGCENTSFVTVDQNDELPEINITEPQELNCSIEKVLLEANQSMTEDGLNYTWSTDNGILLSGQNSLTAETNMPGTYTLTISSDLTGCSSSETITVFQNIVLPLAAPSSDGELSCSTQIVNLQSNLNEATDIILDWSTDNGNIIGPSDSETTEVDQPGTYTLSITSIVNQCSSSFDIEVEQNSNIPTVSIQETEQLTCVNESVILDGSASSSGTEYLYQWSTQDGNILNETNSEVITVNVAGTYELLVTNTENGCSEISTIEIFSDQELPIATAGENQELNCYNTTLNLSGEGSSIGDNIVYEWTTPDGNIVSGANTMAPLIDDSGFYTLTILNTINGCRSESLMQVTENFDAPVINIPEPDLLTCVNETSEIFFTYTSSGTSAFEWSTANGNIIPGTELTLPEVNAAGTYTVQVTDLQSGCTSTAFVEVFQDTEAPIVDAGDGIELTCNQSEYILSATGSTGNIFEYSWTSIDGNILNNLESLNPTVNEAGTYTLEIININNGCVASDEVLITKNENVPTALEALIEPPLCFGDAGSIEIDFIEGGTEPYLYSINGGQTYFEEDYFDLLPSGEYNLMIQDANGCEFMNQVLIPSVAPINVDLIPQVNLLFGASEQISSDLTNIDPLDIESITWTPTEGLSCSNCLDPIATPSSDITYTLTITTHNGCETSASIEFKLDREISIYIPNAFSPHSKDGINDIFYIFAKDGAVTKIHSFQIYDRWGNKVFVDTDFLPNDPNHGWDGLYRDEEMNSGVFVYYAEIELIDGRIEIYKGDITLME